VVLRTGEREAVVHDFVASGSSRCDALLFRFTASAPGGHPNARRGSIARGGFAQFCEPVGKALMKLPQRGRIVPAIVEEKRVDGNATLLRQLCTESIDDLQRTGLIVLVEVAEVVPRVVVEKRPIRMRTFTLD